MDHCTRINVINVIVTSIMDREMEWNGVNAMRCVAKVCLLEVHLTVYRLVPLMGSCDTCLVG